MREIKDLTMDDLEYLIEQKLLEMLGDPDSGLELTEEFKRKLRERLGKPSKRIPHEEVLKNLARVEWTEGAVRDLGKLDSQIRQRILRKIEWLSRNLEKVVPEPLH